MELRMVRRTDHFEEACRFYGEVLGWQVTKQWDAEGDNPRGRIFGFGASARVELLDVPLGTAEAVQGVELSVQVDDAVAVAQRIEAAGLVLAVAVRDTPWGHRACSIIDPCGLRVTLFQVLDG
jgi:catechol 2,3-dioxygenase-like lactoylglutathione lyase family enzyme